MLSYRLIHGVSLGGRSQCVTCRSTIAAYDLVPVFSWLNLRGACRACKSPISPLYPFIELISLILFTSMYLYLPSDYWTGYSIFFSALIITIRSDLDSMLFSLFATLFLISIV